MFILHLILLPCSLTVNRAPCRNEGDEDAVELPEWRRNIYAARKRAWFKIGLIVRLQVGGRVLLLHH